MSLKNYTSSVPAMTSIAWIEKCLADFGAEGVMKEFDGGRTSGIRFAVKVDGKSFVFKLPAKVDAVERELKKAVRRPRAGTAKKLADQAERTAWKLMLDWVQVQMSIIRLGQAELVEVFLPYAWDGRRTYYDHLRESGFKALTDGREKGEGKAK